MSRCFYRLVPDDTLSADRWFLGPPLGENGSEIDPRLFTYAEPYTGERPTDVPVLYPGRVVAFNFADFDMPVVSRSIADLLSGVCPTEVELFPVRVEGMEEGSCILNATSRCVCLDERRSEILKWSVEDGRPDKIGQYRMVTHLTLDPERARNHDIFRVDGWEIALIVSDRLWEHLEQLPALGLRADAVT